MLYFPFLQVEFVIVILALELCLDYIDFLCGLIDTVFLSE